MRFIFFCMMAVGLVGFTANADRAPRRGFRGLKHVEVLAFLGVENPKARKRLSQRAKAQEEGVPRSPLQGVLDGFGAEATCIGHRSCPSTKSSGPNTPNQPNTGLRSRNRTGQSRLRRRTSASTHFSFLFIIFLDVGTAQATHGFASRLGCDLGVWVPVGSVQRRPPTEVQPPVPNCWACFCEKGMRELSRGPY